MLASAAWCGTVRPDVSDEESSTGDDQVGRIDDPDWVDQIVARALAKAEGAVRSAALDADTKADPGTRSRSVAEVAADAAMRAGDRALATPPAAFTPPPPERAPARSVSTAPATSAGTPPAPVVDSTAPPETAATDLVGEQSSTTDDAVADATEPTPPPLADERSPDDDATATAHEPVLDQLLVADDERHPDDDVGDLEVVDADENEDDDESGGAMRSIVEWGAVIVGALVVAFLIKTFLLQAFFIPSGSMEPTLNIGDRVLVNKLAYDFHGVNRGDLVVFDRPSAEEGGVPDLIKRVIALSGETIQFRDGIIYVDNRRLDEPYQPPGAQTAGLSLTNAGATLCGGADVCTVPEGYVFVMGDNRSDSRDSRFFGPIPEDAIVGRAFLRVWPLDNIEFL